ncbi:hypothetical protein GCM10010387_15990 [Streptomyces inusitatus]|uniref:Uncharacterized protein n=1 Tax=Streptomyces inusitatus TaxID=68221 RepID=A0A918PUF5_9ACTN|nr:hypothetical protein [Streptomyces inusitatus]GGZ23596.1 hypothetical protein GCM10010387_15990 [Streptomyces inusitatus]
MTTESDTGDQAHDWYTASLHDVLEDAALDNDDRAFTEEAFPEAFATALARLRALPGVPPERDPVVDALELALSDIRTAVERGMIAEDPFRAGRSAYLRLFN